MVRQLLIATRKGLFVATEGTQRWAISEPEFRGVSVSAVLHDGRDGSLYAALAHGHFGVKLHRRSGRRWTELAAPEYPQLPKGKTEKDAFGRPWPRTLKLVWSLEVDPRQPGAVWCGTIPGGLFHTADRGASWQWNAPLWAMPERRRWLGGGNDWPGIHSIVVDPRDANVVTLGVSCGGALRTRDGGASWHNVAHGMRAAYLPKERAFDVDQQDPHRLAICRGVPDRMWCQHHNGIFVTDGGEAPRWREVKAKAPSRFGFAVAAHPHDPDVAWFVPAEKDECRVPVDGALCVLRTTDGGRTLQALRNGLPQEHAYDLVWRHALDVSRDGATLAMGSTSGRLWLGTDGGERWHEFAVNLPPIHAVRWVDPE